MACGDVLRCFENESDYPDKLSEVVCARSEHERHGSGPLAGRLHQGTLNGRLYEW